MSGITLEMSSRPSGWEWSLRSGPATIASGNSPTGNEAIATARIVLNDILDAGLEAEICSPFAARSLLRGMRPSLIGEAARS